MTEKKIEAEDKAEIKKKIKTSDNNLKTEKKDTNTKKIKNLVKDVEYTSVDEKGNRFYLLANSGKSNPNNNDLSLIHI